MSEPHERLDQAMDDRRLELRMSWTRLAREAEISPQALRAVRRGEYRPSRLTAQALDRALQWSAGSVERILVGGEPKPLGSDEDAEEDPFERLDRITRELQELREQFRDRADRDEAGRDTG